MVHFASIVGVASLFAGFASALPRPDSASGPEVAVSAPNGVIESDTAALAYATAAAAAYASASSVSSYYASAAPYYSSSASSSYGYAPSQTYAPAATYAATSAAPAYGSMATYGSGSSNWSSYGSGSGYDSCVQQCVASYGAPPATWMPSATASSTYSGGSGSSGSSGNGVTHTVVVAPTQGVLRYVPFAVNASVGDTIHFEWHANNHTVTKSSQLEICNKTADAPFASGEQNLGFTFDQVVNDTNPTFFYCGTPTHCQKGMFGIINPPSSFGVSTSVGMQMQNLTSTYPQLSAMASYTNTQAASNPSANDWATNLDMGSMPDWSHEFVAENVLYTRLFMAQNPDVIQADGSINMNTNAPLMFPQDISTVDNAAAAPSSSSSVASIAASSTSAASSSTVPNATMAPSMNGARSTAVSGGILAVAAIAATFLAL